MPRLSYLVNRAANTIERKLGRTRLFSRPSELTIEPTLQCNSDCIMCNRSFNREEDKLAQALSRYFGESVRLEFEPQAADALSPARSDEHAERNFLDSSSDRKTVPCPCQALFDTAIAAARTTRCRPSLVLNCALM